MQEDRDERAYRAAVWKRDFVSMLPRCTPNSSRLDSSRLLNTVPLATPVCFLFRACNHQIAPAHFVTLIYIDYDILHIAWLLQACYMVWDMVHGMLQGTWHGTCPQ